MAILFRKKAVLRVQPLTGKGYQNAYLNLTRVIYI